MPSRDLTRRELLRIFQAGALTIPLAWLPTCSRSHKKSGPSPHTDDQLLDEVQRRKPWLTHKSPEPWGALLMSDAVYEAVFDSLEHAFSHGSTFAPNDYAMVAGLATLTVPFEIAIPPEKGKYQLVAQLRRPGQPAVESLRDFAVGPEAERSENLARARPVTASSSVTVGDTTYAAAYAVDGNIWTRWSSEFSDSQWIAIDLGRSTRISRVELVWEAAYGKAYAIQVSDDGRTWKTVHRTEAGRGDIETIRFLPVEARWVRMLGSKRGSPTGGYSLYEFKVFR